MKNFKKLICILITAALAVTFAFALVACNKDPKPTEMTQADFDELEGYRLATMDYSTYRTDITTETTTDDGVQVEEKSVGFYYNSLGGHTITIDTVLKDESGKTVSRTYYLASDSSTQKKTEAEAVYEGDSTTPTSSEFNESASDVTIGEILPASGAHDAVNEILNAKPDKVDIVSAKVTKYSDDHKAYVIEYTDDGDTEKTTISVTVKGGTFSSVTVTSGNVSYTTTYEFNIGILSMTEAEWYAQHPRA